jgi:hypothetical protein
MARGPICGETNPVHVCTPGPTGYNDAADPNQPLLETELAGPRPLGTRPKTRGSAKRMTVADADTSKQKPKKADAVANLTKPSAATIQTLSARMESVQKLNQEFEPPKKKNEPLTEELRLKNQDLVKDIVKAYGVGQSHVTGLEVDRRTDSVDYADTRGTFIIAFVAIFADAEGVPGFCASVIIHESSHAQRNDELQKAGIGSLSDVNDRVWSALKEVEGAQLELDSAAVTGITAKQKNAATRLRDHNLAEIESLMGADTRTKVENGGLDDIRDKFIQKLKSKQKSQP